MAGAGYKLFNTGDVLTAAQVNTYLNEQTVMVFASSTARTTALSGVLAEGMMSYLQDTNAVEVYNGTSWVNVGNAGDLTEIVAGTGITVTSGTGPIPTVALTTPVAATNGGTAQSTYTTGDLLYASGTNTLAKRAIGATGNVLTVSGGVPTWAAPSSGSANSDSAEVTTSQTTTSTSYTDLSTAGPAVTVTTGTKALVIITSRMQPDTIDNTNFVSYAVSGATTISADDKFAIVFRASGTNAQNILRASSAFMVENLTAGSNTFTMKYKVAGATGYFENRQITVIDMGS